MRKFWPECIPAAFRIQLAAAVLVAAHLVLGFLCRLLNGDTFAWSAGTSTTRIDSAGLCAVWISGRLLWNQVCNPADIRGEIAFRKVDLVMFTVASTCHSIISKE